MSGIWDGYLGLLLVSEIFWEIKSSKKVLVKLNWLKKLHEMQV